MRLEARVLEGGEILTEIVPLRSLIAFKSHFGKGVNWYIDEARKPDSDVDFDDWEPWLSWRTMADKADEARDFDEWAQQVEWVGVYQAPDELDPSGGEATQTPAPSPASSSAPTARGQSSSRSTTTSSKRSGKN